MGEFGAIRNCPPSRRPLEMSVAGADEARTETCWCSKERRLRQQSRKASALSSYYRDCRRSAVGASGSFPQGLEPEERLRTEGKDPLSGVLGVPREVVLIPRSEDEVDAEGSSLVLEISADEPPGKGRFITRLWLAAHRKGVVKSELIRLKSVGSAPRGCRHCRQLLGADPVVGVLLFVCPCH